MNIQKVVLEVEKQYRHLKGSVDQIRQDSRKNRSVALDAVSKAAKKLMRLEKQIDFMSKHDSTSTASNSTLLSSVSTVTMNKFVLLANGVDTIKEDDRKLTAKGNSSAVQFHHLGVRSENDMKSWNAINNPQKTSAWSSTHVDSWKP